MLLAAAIDQRVSPGWTVWGTEALAGAHAARAASAPSAPMRVGFRTASCLRVLLASTAFMEELAPPSRRAVLWPPAKAVANAALGSIGMRLIPVLLAADPVAGPGAKGFKNRTAGFTQAGKTPTEQAILRTIATYRTTGDEARACGLITRHFLNTSRFDGKLRNCEQVLRSASQHLPDDASRQSVSGATARVLVDEPTATKSIYVMRREGATW